MTEDELTAILLAKSRANFKPDPEICRIAARHILAFMADLTDEQEAVVMAGVGRFLAEIELVETARMALAAQHASYRASVREKKPKPKAFDKFISAITLDWLV